jgi:uncharacterized membrane protein YgcG
MIGRANVIWAACAATIALTSPNYLAASDAAQICNRKLARQALSARNYEVFCRCEVVSTSLILAVQRYRDFAEVISFTLEACPAVANVLSETFTASVGKTSAASNSDSHGEARGGSGGGSDGGSGGGGDNGW